MLFELGGGGIYGGCANGGCEVCTRLGAMAVAASVSSVPTTSPDVSCVAGSVRGTNVVSVRTPLTTTDGLMSVPMRVVRVPKMWCTGISHLRSTSASPSATSSTGNVSYVYFATANGTSSFDRALLATTIALLAVSSVIMYTTASVVGCMPDW